MSVMPTFGGEPEPLPEQPPEGAQPAGAEESAAAEGTAAATAASTALAEAAAELDEVEAALGRLEDGSFDSCRVCGAPIGRDRLQHDPLLTRCPQHATAGPTPTAGPPPA